MSSNFNIDNLGPFWFDDKKYSKECLEYIVEYYYFRSVEKDRIKELFQEKKKYEEAVKEITKKAKEHIIKKLEGKEGDERVRARKVEKWEQERSKSSEQKTSDSDCFIRSKKRQKIDDGKTKTVDRF